jgi:hypothetical protein
VIIGWGTGGLQDEHVFTANVFVDFDRDLTIRKTIHRCSPERDVQVADHTMSKLGVRVTAENDKIGHDTP